MIMWPNSLTTAEEAAFVEFRAGWHAAWRSCAPADRAAVEDAIASLYARKKLRRPEFAWAASPADAVAKSVEIAGKLKVTTWDAVRDAIDVNLGTDLGRRLLEGFAFLGTEDRVFDGDLPRDRYGINFRYRRGSIGSRMAFNQAAASTALIAIFARDACGVAVDASVDVRAAVLRGVWHWWPFRDACIVCERPAEIRLDDVGRFHDPSGPAVVYRDGWSVHAIRGTVVPAAWIRDPKSITPAIALTWPNVEQRGIAAEIVGWAVILKDFPHAIVDENPNPEIGTLLRVDLLGQRGALFLKVLCGTGREFVLPVPAEMRTALQANAWTYNVAEDQILNLEART